jgi:hypothetical protein
MQGVVGAPFADQTQQQGLFHLFLHIKIQNSFVY